jgi:hypothetical protein
VGRVDKVFTWIEATDARLARPNPLANWFLRFSAVHRVIGPLLQSTLLVGVLMILGAMASAVPAPGFPDCPRSLSWWRHRCRPTHTTGGESGDMAGLLARSTHPRAEIKTAKALNLRSNPPTSPYCCQGISAEHTVLRPPHPGSNRCRTISIACELTPSLFRGPTSLQPQPRVVASGPRSEGADDNERDNREHDQENVHGIPSRLVTKIGTRNGSVSNGRFVRCFSS